MLFFTSSYITGQVSFSGKESSTNKQFISQKKSSDEERVPFRVMSWNVENLFDTHHDTLKNDNEFLPDAIRHWNYTKYKKKLADIARVITAVGEWNPPALVGLCEVENDSVLRDLTQRSPLKELNYRYVMTNSPDLRGIDVALLYQRDLFKLISFHSIPIPSFKQHRPTRDLLHVSGLLLTGDTLDVIVCHLPSRSGGAKESEPYRLHAARILRTEADSLLSIRLHPQLIIMVGVAAETALTRTRLKRGILMIPISIAFFVTVVLVGLYFLGFVLKLDNIFSAQYFIPVFGIIMGNMLGVNVIGLNTYYAGLRREQQLYYFLLGNGATRNEAIAPFVRQALIKAFSPGIANMAVTGLVALPGTMIGQILGGSSPHVAIKYQIMIVVITVVASMLSLMMTIFLASRKSFDSYGRLLRVHKDTKRK